MPYKNQDEQRKYQRELRHKNRQLVQRYKLWRRCDLCGYNRCAPALEFHHLGNKTRRVGQMLNCSKKRIKQEISKCTLLCANCHREQHMAP